MNLNTLGFQARYSAQPGIHHSPHDIKMILSFYRLVQQGGLHNHVESFTLKVIEDTIMDRGLREVGVILGKDPEHRVSHLGRGGLQSQFVIREFAGAVRLVFYPELHPIKAGLSQYMITDPTYIRICTHHK